MKTNLLATALTVVLAVILFGLAPATAGTINFDFCAIPGSNCVVPSASEDSSLGTTDSFTVSGLTIHAAGFGGTSSGGANISTGSTVNLWAKNGGGDETGLGLANDPSGDHEISGSFCWQNCAPTNLIEISLPAPESKFSFQMGSSTSGEGWLVYGSNSPSSGFVLVDSGTDENSHTLTGTTPGLNDGNYQYYYFAFNWADYDWNNGNNVLLENVDFNVSSTPIPGTLPLLATGLVGLFALRRKRKVAAIAA
jgi:hypothetical protein